MAAADLRKERRLVCIVQVASLAAPSSAGPFPPSTDTASTFRAPGRRGVRVRGGIRRCSARRRDRHPREFEAGGDLLDVHGGWSPHPGRGLTEPCAARIVKQSLHY